MKEGVKADEINVDTRISIIKPGHANWVISFYDYMKNHSNIVLAGRRKSKIEEFFNSKQDVKSNPFFVNNIKIVLLSLEENVLLD